MISLFTYSARLGFHYRSLDESFERNPLGSEVTVGAAASVRVANKKLPPTGPGAVWQLDCRPLERRTPLMADGCALHIRFSGLCARALAPDSRAAVPAVRTFLSAGMGAGNDGGC